MKYVSFFSIKMKKLSLRDVSDVTQVVNGNLIWEPNLLSQAPPSLLYLNSTCQPFIGTRGS